MTSGREKKREMEEEEEGKKTLSNSGTPEDAVLRGEWKARGAKSG